MAATWLLLTIHELNSSLLASIQHFLQITRLVGAWLFTQNVLALLRSLTEMRQPRQPGCAVVYKQAAVYTTQHSTAYLQEPLLTNPCWQWNVAETSGEA